MYVVVGSGLVLYVRFIVDWERGEPIRGEGLSTLIAETHWYRLTWVGVDDSLVKHAHSRTINEN